MYRLFVALRPPPAVRELLLSTMDGIDGARWQSDDQLHCTLRFVGEVERPVAEDVAHALSAVRADGFELSLDGVGHFAGRAGGRSVWAGVTPHGAVAALHRKIDRAVVRCGLPPERRAYLPHVTLARLNARSGPVDGFLARYAGLRSAPFAVEAFHLFASHLGGDRAEYDVVSRYPLKSGG